MRARWGVVLALVGLAAAGGYLLTAVAIEAGGRLLSAVTGTPTGTPSGFAEGTALRFGILGAVLAVAWVLIRLGGWALRPGAFRAGADAEWETARALRALERRGFTVLHDLAAPGGRGNIDHLVIGPAGVTVVETKGYRGTVRLGWRRMRVDGRDRSEDLEQVRRTARAVERRLARAALGLRIPVRMALCLPSADLVRPLLRPAAVRGIRVCDPRSLVRHLRAARTALSPAEVAQAVRACDDLRA